MRIELILSCAFVVTSLLMLFLASDLGEQLKNTFVGVWCPDDPLLPMLAPSVVPRIQEFDEAPQQCRERVGDALQTAISMALCVCTVYACIVLWVALTSSSSSNNWMMMM